MTGARVPQLLRMRKVAALLGVSRWTLRRIIERDASFPRFIEISPGVRVVREVDLERWLHRKQVETLEAQAAPVAPRLPVAVRGTRRRPSEHPPSES